MVLRKRTRYSADFKRNAVELTLQDGKMVKEVAEDLGIHPTMLSKWRGEYLADSEEAFPGQGTIWEDTNGDGTLDGDETGIYEGVTVDLYEDVNNNGVIDEGDRLVGTDTTDSSGGYSFANLPPGKFIVDVSDDDNVLDGAWHSEGTNNNTPGQSQSDPKAVTVSASSETTVDFGYYEEAGSVGNRVWIDQSEDGLLNNGELGAAGVVVVLTITYPNGDEVVITTVSDSSGFYSFDNLLLDEDYDGEGGGQPQYVVSVPNGPGSAPDSSENKTPTDPDGVDNGIDNNADLTGGEAAFPTQGEMDATNDFGFYSGPTAVNLRSISASSPGPAVFLWTALAAFGLLAAGFITSFTMRRKQMNS